jgi:hypothetical protein
MAVQQTSIAKEVGHHFAREIGVDPVVEGLFVQGSRPITVWLLTAPLNIEDTARYYDASVQLQRAFPDTPIDFHLINPSFFEDDVDLAAHVIPAAAESIDLRS